MENATILTYVGRKLICVRCIHWSYNIIAKGICHNDKITIVYTKEKKLRAFESNISLNTNAVRLSSLKLGQLFFERLVYRISVKRIRLVNQ